MIRISNIAADGARPVLRVEGRIVGPWVDLLEATCRGLGDLGLRGQVLDLSGVTFASPSGLTLLRRLEAEGVAFRGCPGYLRDLCDGR